MNLRLLSFNIHKGIGWRRNATMDKIKIQILDLDADIVFLQEVRGAQFEQLCTDMPHYHFCYGKNAVYANGHHGNVVLSKFPITFSQNTDMSMHRFERRGLLHAKLTLPNDQVLHVLCVHLGLRARDRHKQLAMIVNYINLHVPETDAIIMAGDFNDWGSHATHPIIQQLHFEEAFLHHRHAYAKTWPAWIPVLKLDRLYYRGLQFQDAHRLIQKQWRYLSDHVALNVSLQLE